MQIDEVVLRPGINSRQYSVIVGLCASLGVVDVVVVVVVVLRAKKRLVGAREEQGKSSGKREPSLKQLSYLKVP